MSNKNFEVKHGLSVGGTQRISSTGVGTFTDLNVTGTTTTIDTATLQVQDKNIVINYGSGDTSSTASGAGITIQDAVNSSTDATLLWDASADEFDFSHAVTAPSLKSTGASTFDSTLTSTGLLLTENTSLYNVNATISYYSSTNGVYVNGAGNNGWLRLNASGTQNARNSIDLYGSSAGDYIKIKAANTDTMYIGANGAGRVGIGTSTPSQTLHVAGNAFVSGSTYLGDSSADITYIQGNVGIGTSSPFSDLQIGTNTFSGNNGMYADSRVGISNHGELTGLMLASTYDNSSFPEYGLVFVQGPSTSSYNVWSISPDGPAKGDSLNFIYGSNSTNIHTTSPKVVFDGNGNVGIGETSPLGKLHVKTADSGASADSGADELVLENSGDAGITIMSGTSNSGSIRFGDSGDNDNGIIIYNHGSSPYMRFFVDASEKIRIDSSGRVGISESTPNNALLHLNQTSVAVANGTADFSAGTNLSLWIENSASGGYPRIFNKSNSSSVAVVTNYEDGKHAYWGEPGDVRTYYFRGTGSSSVNISGSLSKGSGSFKIEHPLESKKDTHNLVHSFVESPQANNIYRGVTELENGTATINLDTASGMSEGTYILLNTNTQCFTSNESDWDAVKGSVLGNILTISCQNTSSTAKVSWMVIGERQDQHIIDANWTDEYGKVIVEPLKDINE